MTDNARQKAMSTHLALDEAGRERLERLVEEVVLRISDRKLERVQLHVHVLDLEHAGLVLLRAREVHGRSKALAADNDVRETRVGDLREAGLLAEPEGDVAHVRLDLAEREGELMVVLVLDRLVRRELEEVVGLERDDVREEVAAGEREVLDNEVHHVVGILDARDGDIPDLQGSRQIRYTTTICNEHVPGRSTAAR